MLWSNSLRVSHMLTRKGQVTGSLVHHMACSALVVPAWCQPPSFPVCLAKPENAPLLLAENLSREEYSGKVRFVPSCQDTAASPSRMPGRGELPLGHATDSFNQSLSVLRTDDMGTSWGATRGTQIY